MKISREVGNEGKARCTYPLQGRNEPWGKTLEREIGASMRESSVDLPTKWRGRENRETSGRVERRRSRCDQTGTLRVDPLPWGGSPHVKGAASCLEGLKGRKNGAASRRAPFTEQRKRRA
ncbi:hypothetical protein K0M31_000727 [Melipona bicolor]|uniref:Uncharacterized protein n=1 Tax=Melipona bicolor TaxID=60889 RepID=A0AA40KX38_9HYME|nr:hypothetical protein K0M31_000727 [Melipona bicolor]